MRTEKQFVADRLRLARTFLGRTQTELAESVNVTRAFVYKLERGDTRPTDDLRAALVESLGFPDEFFSRALTDELREEQAHFRKRATTPAHLKHQAAAHGTLFAEAIDYFDERLSLPPIDIPSIACSTAEEIESAAEQARANWGLGIDTPIKNMVRVLEHAGAVVATFDGPSSKVDAFSWSRRRPIVVRSTLKESPTRARWDYAHECGHLVLHDGASLEEHEAETQANRFAGAFLLPRAGFVREYPRSQTVIWPRLLMLKQRWGASLQAMIRRAYDLRLIDARQYRFANITVAKRGWKKSEPNEPDTHEAPEVVPGALKHLATRQGLTQVHIAHDLCWTPEILRQVLGQQIPTSDDVPPHVMPFRRSRRAQPG